MKKFFIFIFFLLSCSSIKKYKAKWESIDSRPTPQWFKDAKFGIFIHWGLYSVPAWGPKGSYAEWYLNGLLNGDTARTQYHNKNYGNDFPYKNFINLFNPISYDPNKWADLFQKAGAKYVVLTSKHHDGFCLWPSDHSQGYNSFDGMANRDLLGDLNQAIKKKGIRSGFYYSLYEWEHSDYPENVPLYVDNYMLPQLKDAVQRYEPDIIFSDGEWDRYSTEWKSEEFLAWLYNDSNAPKDVVVNDRWGGETRFKHGGYFSTEYDPNSGAMNEEFLKRGWEECRGIGKSFGYNQNETIEDYSTSEELIRLLVDIVSRGGNLLLNIGPKSDGTIPDIMSDRLFEIGNWLEINGDAIYGTTPNRIFQSNGIKFTLSKDRKTLFAFVEKFQEKTLKIRGVNATGEKHIQCLGSDQALEWENKGSDLIMQVTNSFIDDLKFSPIYVLQIPVLPYLDKPKVQVSIENKIAEISINSDNSTSTYLFEIGDTTNNNLTREYKNPFQITEPGILHVQATNKNHLPSKIFTLPINILTNENGLVRRTYLGQWDSCSEMINEKFTEESIVYDFSIDKNKKDNFGHVFSGHIAINNPGIYKFQTISDDGSRLLINDELIVDNDGLHSKASSLGSVYLEKKMHKIVVEYFERGGQEFLEVNWTGPGFEWQAIPSYKLFHKNN